MRDTHLNWKKRTITFNSILWLKITFDDVEPFRKIGNSVVIAYMPDKDQINGSQGLTVRLFFILIFWATEKNDEYKM